MKKPYNPILGEVFRCRWEHGDRGTTHYVAEQVMYLFRKSVYEPQQSFVTGHVICLPAGALLFVTSHVMIRQRSPVSKNVQTVSLNPCSFAPCAEQDLCTARACNTFRGRPLHEWYSYLSVPHLHSTPAHHVEIVVARSLPRSDDRQVREPRIGFRHAMITC